MRSHSRATVASDPKRPAAVTPAPAPIPGESATLWSVLVANVAGSCAIGLLAGSGASEQVRLVAGIESRGGLTTFGDVLARRIRRSGGW